MTRVLVEQSGRVLHLINNAPEKRNALDYDYYDGVPRRIGCGGRRCRGRSCFRARTASFALVETLRG